MVYSCTGTELEVLELDAEIPEINALLWSQWRNLVSFDLVWQGDTYK
ncbi:MAG: hypothetical protein R2883_02460 [Caldisericia bacterium]